MLGTLYVIVAPSGAGKTSLVRALVDCMDKTQVSVSYTTRAPRPGEQEGVSYHFISPKAFEEKVKRGDFLEYAQVFDHSYGTSRQWVETRLKQGIDVILEIDWQGAQQIREKMSCVVGIFILPPSLKALEHRLMAREQDSPLVIARRLKEASLEISHYQEFDYLLVNHVFEDALADLQSIFKAERLKKGPQAKRHQQLLENLLKTE